VTDSKLASALASPVLARAGRHGPPIPIPVDQGYSDGTGSDIDGVDHDAPVCIRLFNACACDQMHESAGINARVTHI
jgi:hypothetical protein